MIIYILIGSVVIIGAISYFYYSAMTEYLQSLGKSVLYNRSTKEIVKTMEELVKNEQITKDALDLMKELPKISSPVEQAKAFKRFRCNR